jgi:HAD superfamily hydrolase (TIGR01484 family)
MKPLSTLTEKERSAISTLAFDLDDTLLTHGALTLEAYTALCKLREAGFRLVAITGRPANWGSVIAKQWPIDGCIVENGALAFYNHAGRIKLWDPLTSEAREAHTCRLSALISKVALKFEDIALADDSNGRMADVAWDVREFAKIPDVRINALQAFLLSEGAATLRSSVHVHASFEVCDKASGFFQFAHYRWQELKETLINTVAFVGDSGNDAACFAAFGTTIGVANVREQLAWIPKPPRFITLRDRGAGFAELAAQLIETKVQGREV